MTSINNQLEAVSNTLRLLVDKSELPSQLESSNDNFNSTPTTIHAVAELPYGKQCARLTGQRDYEGESSFYSQSKRIADTLSLAVSPASGDATNAQAAAVGTMRALIQDAKAVDSPTCGDGLSHSTSCSLSQYPELAGLSLPPIHSVLRLLAFARESPQRYFIKFAHTNEEEFAELCQKLYFPTRPFTICVDQRELWIILSLPRSGQSSPRQAATDKKPSL